MVGYVQFSYFSYFFSHNKPTNDIDKAILTESVYLSTQIMTTPLMLEIVSGASPPMLSPSLYLQFLQAKAREPILYDDDVLLKAQSLEFPKLYKYIKNNVPASILMSQNDIKEVLTSIASSLLLLSLVVLLSPLKYRQSHQYTIAFAVDKKRVMLHLNTMRLCPKHLPGHIPHHLPLAIS